MIYWIIFLSTICACNGIKKFLTLSKVQNQIFVTLLSDVFLKGNVKNHLTKKTFVLGILLRRGVLKFFLIRVVYFKHFTESSISSCVFSSGPPSSIAGLRPDSNHFAINGNENLSLFRPVCWSALCKFIKQKFWLWLNFPYK